MNNKLEVLNAALKPLGFRIGRNPIDSLLFDLIKMAENARFTRQTDRDLELSLSKFVMQITLRRILKKLSIRTVIDVGANEGQFSYLLRGSVTWERSFQSNRLQTPFIGSTLIDPARKPTQYSLPSWRSRWRIFLFGIRGKRVQFLT